MAPVTAIYDYFPNSDNKLIVRIKSLILFFVKQLFFLTVSFCEEQQQLASRLLQMLNFWQKGKNNNLSS